MFLLNLASGRGESEATHGAYGGRSLFEAPLQVVPRRERDIRCGRAPRTAFQVIDAEGVLSKHGADSRRHWRDEGRRVRSRALLQRLRGPAGHPDVCVQIKTKKVSYGYGESRFNRESNDKNICNLIDGIRRSGR